MMFTFLWLLVFFFAVTIPLYHRASLPIFSLATGIVLFTFTYLVPDFLSLKIVFWVLWALVTVFNIRPIRHRLLTKYLLKFYRKVKPAMSDTEREALEAGTVWWDRELFSGRPNWNTMLQHKTTTLREDEVAFVEGPAETLCGMLDDWEITHKDADLSPETWRYIKDNGFFGMIIPKAYGGLELSSTAIASVIVKLFARSITAGTTVCVPNSLGPGELLMHYGTEAQKDYYLPRLARGEEIPCFALTSPDAGSDASNMPDSGVICEGMHEGKKVIGLRLNFDKRYITLAPIATVIGLAFKAYDPDHLLSDKTDLGITCALIPHDTPGIEAGKRHYPASAVFHNGPVRGKDVFIPLDYIIGGQEMLGGGWRMLMECLAAGRAISLPSTAVAIGQFMCKTGAAYSRIRRQFNVSIGKFEGIEECLGRIGGYTYQMNAMTKVTQSAIDMGQKPPVISAILKLHCTELGRKVVTDAMDIHGGKGVCLGPENYLARGYQGMPIAITVEGANILTRCMIVFGQGVIRCHPYVLDEIHAAETDDADTLATFDKAVFGHIGFMLSNIVRTTWLSVTNGRIAFAPKGPCKRYMKQLTRFSSAFALLSDVMMAVLGADLKRRERISARLGDILSYLYIATSVIKHYNDEGKHREDLPLVHWACQDALFKIQTAFQDILNNMKPRIVARIMSEWIFPFGARLKAPSDQLDHKISNLLMNPTNARERLSADVSGFGNTDVTRLEETLQAVMGIESVEKTVTKAGKEGELDGYSLKEWIQSALDKDMITKEQYQAWQMADKLRADIIKVDEFDSEDLMHHSRAKNNVSEGETKTS
jgi:acyl-CoA dehydrogenase